MDNVTVKSLYGSPGMKTKDESVTKGIIRIGDSNVKSIK